MKRKINLKKIKNHKTPLNTEQERLEIAEKKSK